MLTKKILVLATAAAISAPALADRGHGHRDYRHDHRGHHYGHRVAVQKAYVPSHYYYRPAPRPVYVVHPAPQPVVVHQHRSNIGPALVFGAVLGAVIAGSVAASR
jgi:hypothetical protein